MTSIINLFTNSGNGSQKTINDHAREYKENKEYLNTPSPAITQGEKFKRYQNKIKKNLEKKSKLLKEGFQGGIENNLQLSAHGLTAQTNNVIQSNDYSSQQQTITNLQNQYQTTLTEYENLVSKISGNTKGYINRVNPNNPYLGKNVRFNNGSIGYVTKQGVVKWYGNWDTFVSCSGKNGCPPQQEIINIDIPFDTKYWVAGTTIPTNPPLLSGTSMQPTESCGNEGSNVYVDTMINNPTAKYDGCYADNTGSPLMTFIGGAPPPPSGTLINGNFDQPQLANNSFRYLADGSTVPGWGFFTALINNSSAWGYPMPYPRGPQAASIQGTGRIAQSIQLNSGTYTLSFYACGRPGYLGANTINAHCYIYSGQDPWSVPFIYSVTPPSSGWQQYNTTFNLSQSGNYYFGFYGTANTGDKSTAVQNIRLTPGSNVGSGGGSYTYKQCMDAAVDQGYQYFALQNVNTSTSQGYCAVSNDQPTITKLGPALTPGNFSVVWLSNTSGQSGNVATLTSQGSLAVYSSSGQRLFYTDYSKSQPSNYLGCYQDSEPRALEFHGGGFNYQTCQQLARQLGHTYFGLQYSTTGENAQCTSSNSLSQSTRYGPAGNCTQLSNGNWSGGGWSNAVYNANNPSSNYYLILQDDGNLVVYRGTSPNDNQGFIWASGTNGKAKDANPDWVASKGKYGRNYMTQGSVLAAGDWIGNNTGTMQLLMQADGNLALYVCGMVPNTKQIADDKIGGGVGANAIYDIGKKGYQSNIGKVAYIDENAVLHAYPSSNVKYANSYKQMKGFDSGGHDIPGAAYGNASVESCTNSCNANENCAGFAFSNNVCYPKDSTMYPNGQRQNLSHVDLYIRNKSPISRPIGVPDSVNAIDSITWQSYVNGGPLSNSYGLANATAAQKAQLEQLQSQMNLLTSQISELTGKFSDGSQEAENQSKTNVTGLQGYLKGLKNTNNKIDGIEGDGNLNNILKDSDIVVLQKNYDYLFWSILASGSVLVAMNIVKQ